MASEPGGRLRGYVRQVAPRESIAKLRPEVDEIVVLQTPDPFYAVGAWYTNFDQTTDDEVIELLGRSSQSVR